MSDQETPSTETAPQAPSSEQAPAEEAAAQAPAEEAAAQAPAEEAAEPTEAEPTAPEHAESSAPHVAEQHEPEEDLPARGQDPRPFIVLTAIHDANARVAAITLSHADAWERAQKALAGKNIAGMEIVELPVPPRAFTALREHIQRSPETVAVYDLFPLAAHLPRATRKVAGQFLGAEILWALEEQGILTGIPLNLRLDVPRSWGDRSPKSVHEKLMEGGALDLTEAAIEDFRAIKGSWDQG